MERIILRIGSADPNDAEALEELARQLRAQPEVEVVDQEALRRRVDEVEISAALGQTGAFTGAFTTVYRIVAEFLRRHQGKVTVQSGERRVVVDGDSSKDAEAILRELFPDGVADESGPEGVRE